MSNDTPSGLSDFLVSFTPQRLLVTCVRLVAHPSAFLTAVRRNDWAGIASPAGFLVASVAAALFLAIFVPPLDTEARWSHVIGDLEEQEATRVLRHVGINHGKPRDIVLAEMINPLSSPFSTTVKDRVGSVEIESVIAYVAAGDRQLGARLAVRAKQTRAKRSIVATFATVGVTLGIFVAALAMHLILRNSGNQRYRDALYPLMYLRGFWILVAVATAAIYDQWLTTDATTRAAAGAAVNAALFVIMLVQFTWAFRLIYGSSIKRTLTAVLAGKVSSLIAISAFTLMVNAVAEQWVLLSA